MRGGGARGATLPCVLALRLLVQAGVNFLGLFTPGTRHSVGHRLLSALAGGQTATLQTSSWGLRYSLQCRTESPLLCEDLLAEPRASLSQERKATAGAL